jgi:hypothetical protein
MIGTRPLTPNSAGITGPMNLNAVIAHLVDLTPGQRKQFAQLHMDDTMLLSTVKYVDDQIGKQAAANAAQMMGAAPPPVNEQVVAQMAPQPPAPQAAPQPQAGPQDQGQAQPMPEDTGIGQLPAPNMQGIARGAAGGIVAFDEGGSTSMMGELFDSVGNYIGNQLERNKLAVKQAADYGEQREKRRAAVPGLFETLTPAQKIERTKQMREAGIEMARIADTPLQTPKDYKPPKVNYPVTPAAPTDKAPATGAGGGQGNRGTANAPAERPAAPEKKTGIDQLRQEKIPATQAAPPSAAERPAQDLSLDRFMPAGAKRPGESDVEAMNKERLKGAEEALSGFNADVAKRGKAMTEQEARIAVREATSKDRLDTNTNMSLINAGLAMMQSTGKGLAGIAEGAQVGTKQYQAGLREYDNAKEKLDTARDMIEQYRRTEDTMNDKERRALTKDINTTRASGLESLISFRTKIYGEDRADARSMLDITVKQQEGAADRASRERLQTISEEGANRRAAMQERGANARAQMLPGEARTLMALGKGDLQKGLEMKATIEAGKFNPMTAYTSHYLPAFAGKETLNPPMSYMQFLGSLGMPAVRP